MTEFGDLKGIVKDMKAEPIPFAEIAVLKDKVLVTGTRTDIDGKYFIKGIAVGIYTVKASSLGYVSYEDSGVQINFGRVTFLDFTLQNQPSS